MSHATLEELSGILDSVLTEERQRAVEEHVRSCATCRKRLAGLEDVVGGLERLRDRKPPRHLERLVVQGVDRLRRTQSLTQRLETRARRFDTSSPMPAVFGVVLAMAVFIYLLSFAIAREDRGSTRMILGHGPRVTDAPVRGDRREVAERVFLWTGEAWAERGTEEAPVERRVDPGDSTNGPALDALVERLSVLDGPVRFRYRGEVLELPARPSD